MLDINTLNSIRYRLTFKQKQIQEELLSLEKDDPVMLQVVETDDTGGESWQADVHSRIISLKGNLFDLSKRIGDSLQRIKNGTYGICQNCGREIEIERLIVLPTASSCKACAAGSCLTLT